MTASVQPHLEAGETVHAVFGAQTVNQWWAVLTGLLLMLFVNHYIVVVATDRRILVCKSGRFTTTKATEVMRVLARATRIGPASGLWWKCESLGDKMYVHKRFHKDIAAADAMIGQIA
jgi:hypothetical protein